MKKNFFLYTDGASRSNPGESGVGYVLYDEYNNTIARDGYFIGYGTNNYAEYIAPIVALLINFDIVKENNIILYADSLLLINQLKKTWKIKDPLLKKCNKFLVNIQNYLILEPHHIDRKFNQLADEMANKGIDEKKLLPSSILDILSHEIIS